MISPSIGNPNADQQCYANTKIGMRHADEVIEDIRKLRRVRISAADLVRALTELRQIRERIIEARRPDLGLPSGKVIYLCVERWRQRGNTGWDAYRQLPSMSAIFQLALATHPVLRAAVRDKISTVIRELDITIFELERRASAPSLINRITDRCGIRSIMP